MLNTIVFKNGNIFQFMVEGTSEIPEYTVMLTDYQKNCLITNIARNGIDLSKPLTQNHFCKIINWVDNMGSMHPWDV